MIPQTHTIVRDGQTFEVTRDTVTWNIHANMERIQILRRELRQLEKQIRRYKEDLKLIDERKSK